MAPSHSSQEVVISHVSDNANFFYRIFISIRNISMSASFIQQVSNLGISMVVIFTLYLLFISFINLKLY